MKYPASLLLVPPLICCEFGGNHSGRATEPPATPLAVDRTADPKEDPYRASREAMVSEQIENRGIKEPRVLAAMRRVPRHMFVPERIRSSAYEDRALPIEENQTISQPYIVGLMTELAQVGPGSKVLEIGTGSGYQAAVLAEMGAKVFSIEIVGELAKQAREVLNRLNHTAVSVRHGDGYDGWPEQAPFDAILITAAPPRIPEPLKQQLKTGGRLISPVGEWSQQLIVLTRTETGFNMRDVLPVIFVPMTGKAQSSAR